MIYDLKFMIYDFLSPSQKSAELYTKC